MEPGMLRACILKAVYFPNTNLMDVALGATPSRVWRSIMNKKNTLEKEGYSTPWYRRDDQNLAHELDPKGWLILTNVS